jgi:AmmeMemoRadiSam system protein A
MASLDLNEKQKKTLLDIARKTIQNTVLAKKLPEFKIEDPTLKAVYGAFVTIHKNKNLRGCIGNVVGRGPLYRTVMQMAVEACMHDPRFNPVEPEELEEIDIEISVLSPFEKIDRIEDIRVGVHGLLIKQGFYQGLLLPQVATEYNWTKTEFLEHTCLKAGLGRSCYKDSKCEIYIFSATVFGEKEGQ